MIFFGFCRRGVDAGPAPPSDGLGARGGCAIGSDMSRATNMNLFASHGYAVQTSHAARKPERCLKGLWIRSMIVGSQRFLVHERARTVMECRDGVCEKFSVENRFT